MVVRAFDDVTAEHMVDRLRRVAVYNAYDHEVLKRTPGEVALVHVVMALQFME